jgi:VanZ family protein
MIERRALRLAAHLVGRRRWLPALVWVAAILVVSSIPGPRMGGPLFPGCDKLAHFIEYSILGVALRFWTEGGSDATGQARRRRIAGMLAAALAFAALDEAHQKFIPGRTASVWDFAADACGLVIGFLGSVRARLIRER